MNDIGVADEHQTLAASRAPHDADDIRPAGKKIADDDFLHSDSTEELGEISGEACLGAGNAWVSDRSPKRSDCRSFIDGMWLDCSHG